MESARTYNSVSRSGYQKKGNLIAFPGLLDDACGTETRQDATQNAKEDFDGIFNKMKAFATSGRLEDKMRRDAMNRIRVECIQFLLYMLFPAISIALPRVAMTEKMLRTSILEEMQKNYVRTAYARGMSRRTAMKAHALKNAMLPMPSGPSPAK